MNLRFLPGTTDSGGAGGGRGCAGKTVEKVAARHVWNHSRTS